jgi:uncharacterized protein (DUF305 family)
VLAKVPAALCAFLILGVSSEAALAQHDHHAAQAPAAPATEEAGVPPLYSPADLQFLQHMVMHHQQAVDMGALVPERSERQAFRRFARYVADAQRAEIRMMEGMLATAAGRGIAAPDQTHMMHADPPMAGMLSAAELAALEASSGAEFERLWLQGMIVHHDGGLAMARAQQLIQFASGRRPPGLDVMVEDILDVQRAEIGMMEGFLEEWGLALGEPVDARDPAAELIAPAPGVALRAGTAATLTGVAVDDRGLWAVEAAIQDLASGDWLRSDGTWGARELLPAEIIGSGPASLAWTFAWTPPAAGRYGVEIEVEDGAGKRATVEARMITVE